MGQILPLPTAVLKMHRRLRLEPLALRYPAPNPE